MKVHEVIGTGFDGVFIPRGVDGLGTGVMHELTKQDIDWRRSRVQSVLEGLGPSNWLPGASNAQFSQTDFVDLSIGEQRVVLLMRALVGEPQLVLLDEVWSGMEEAMVLAARKYLRGDGISEQQAVVVITHWDEEVPWSKEDGLRSFILEKGVGAVV
jgi:ABC-type multidrug transport system ATPase subunit